jgi:predicted alpha/beta superfamily hydrolase
VVCLFAVAVGSLALYAAWRVRRRWKAAEEERRLRAVHTLAGNVHQESFHSDVLGADRRVWVYLPPRYEEGQGRRFPVLYMHDGQNVFDGATAFLAGQEWQADEAAERLIGRAGSSRSSSSRSTTRSRIASTSTPHRARRPGRRPTGTAACCSRS